MQIHEGVRFKESKFWGIKKSSEQGAIRGRIKFMSMKTTEESKTP